MGQEKKYKSSATPFCTVPNNPSCKEQKTDGRNAWTMLYVMWFGSIRYKSRSLVAYSHHLCPEMQVNEIQCSL